MVYISVVLGPPAPAAQPGGALSCGFQSSAHPEPGGGWTVAALRVPLWAQALSRSSRLHQTSIR